VRGGGDLDNLIDEKFVYLTAMIACTHYGKPRKRGKDLRPNQFVFACGCPFSFRVSYSCKQKLLVIINCNTTHQGHLVSAEAIKTYHIKKNITPEALNYAKDALDDGAIPRRVQNTIKENYNMYVPSKFFQNVKQQARGSTCCTMFHFISLLTLVIYRFHR